MYRIFRNQLIDFANKAGVGEIGFNKVYKQICNLAEARVYDEGFLRYCELTSNNFDYFIKNLAADYRPIFSINNSNNFDTSKSIEEARLSNCIYIFDNFYPDLLRDCSDPPIRLYWHGNLGLLKSEKHMAIVGTRRPVVVSPYHVRELLLNIPGDFVTVSGLAVGVDSYVHRQSIKLEIPTIVVLPSYLDRIVPISGSRLADEVIRAGGLIISEIGAKCPVEDKKNAVPKYSFPRRNRIIAGMCDHTYVIEAKKDSGSLITAELAYSYGRQLSVWLPSISNQALSGNLKLLFEQKAELVSHLYKDKRANQHSTVSSILKKQASKTLNPEDYEMYVKILEIENLVPDTQMSLEDLQIRLGAKFGHLNKAKDFSSFIGKLKIMNLIYIDEYGRVTFNID